MRRQVASVDALGGLAEQGFELGEDLLDRIEVGTVGRQEEELGAGGADGAAHGWPLWLPRLSMMTMSPGSRVGHQELLDIGEEACAVDRAVDDAGRVDPVAAQRGEEGQRAPVAVRHLGDRAARPRRSGRGCASCWSWPRSRR